MATAKRRPRRVTRPARHGGDPESAGGTLDDLAEEDRPERWGDVREQADEEQNDARLIGDKPPHWG